LVATGTTALSTGQTYHVAVTKTGSTVRLYVNGELDRSQTLSGSVATNTTAVTLGRRAGGNALGGRIDEVAIYDDALSAARLAAHASAAGVDEDPPPEPGFADSRVLSIPNPTALDFLPDGTMLVATREGRLHSVAPGAATPRLILDISGRVCTPRERGLVGLTVDPSFASNRFVYVYYTFEAGPCDNLGTTNAPVNRVSRFTVRADGTIDPAAETVLLDGIPSVNGNHNGGDLGFGTDGLLYVGVGDGGCRIGDLTRCDTSNDNSRHLDYPLGKILRVTRTGSVPSTNPFVGAAGARRCTDPAGPVLGQGTCSETYVWGLRNPFRFAFDGVTMFINDVGANSFEEIDVAMPGADYGWNVREGRCPVGQTTNCGPPANGMVDPLYDYPHTSGCSAITGGAFVPEGNWPQSMWHDYVFADYVCGKIFLMDRSGGQVTVQEFRSGLGESSAIDLVFGPDGAEKSLYYLSFANGGEVRKISFESSGNTAPTASFTATPMSGTAPLDVAFNATASSDPEGDPVTYLFDFGDGATLETTDPTISHRYATSGSFTAELQVRDPGGLLSNIATRQIDVGNTPPSVTMTSPVIGFTFSTGGTVTLSGTATDAEEGTLPGSALSWVVIRHHDDHTHPYLDATTGSSLQIVGPSPEGLDAVENSHLEIVLTATDSSGASTTVRRDIFPRIVDAQMLSQPPGIRIQVDEKVLTGGQSVKAWAGMTLHLNVGDQSLDGLSWVFDRWSDGGAREHDVVVGTSPLTLTAFKRPVESYVAGERCFGLVPTIEGTPGSNSITGTAGRDVIDGLGGNDTITSLGGNDVVCGGSGADTITLGDGNDVAHGAQGDDDIDGSAGYDWGFGATETDACLTEFTNGCP
jgi:glucose/arabinose dehydrogenase/PKD repeat protein